jgi:hypothetical protein
MNLLLSTSLQFAEGNKPHIHPLRLVPLVALMLFRENGDGESQN